MCVLIGYCFGAWVVLVSVFRNACEARTLAQRSGQVSGGDFWNEDGIRRLGACHLEGFENGVVYGMVEVWRGGFGWFAGRKGWLGENEDEDEDEDEDEIAYDLSSD